MFFFSFLLSLTIYRTIQFSLSLFRFLSVSTSSLLTFTSFIDPGAFSPHRSRGNVLFVTWSQLLMQTVDGLLSSGGSFDEEKWWVSPLMSFVTIEILLVQK